MTDVFLSYSHKDQAFADSLVRGLEAEGVSVWWDHTIPPGQTWDTFIAKGIVDAKAVVVIWSMTSVASDWVKEEASIARNQGKYLPVQIDVTEPPIGFSRIQAAQLKDWDGNRNAPQWQMLVAEVRKIMEGSTPATASRPASSRSTSRPKSSKGMPVFLGGVVAGVLMGGALTYFGASYLNQLEATRQTQEHQKQVSNYRLQLNERAAEIKSLTEKIGPIRNPLEYTTVDTLRVRIEQETERLQSVAKTHPVLLQEIDPELLKPADWRTPTVNMLNARLEKVSNELANAYLRYEGRLPIAPCIGPAC